MFIMSPQDSAQTRAADVKAIGHSTNDKTTTRNYNTNQHYNTTNATINDTTHIQHIILSSQLVENTN